MMNYPLITLGYCVVLDVFHNVDPRLSRFHGLRAWLFCMLVPWDGMKWEENPGSPGEILVKRIGNALDSDFFHNPMYFQ